MATTRPVTPLPITPRHVWLAGLGALMLARREALAGRDRVTAAACESRRRLLAPVGDGVRAALGRAEPVAMRWAGELESRLSPVMARVGLKLASKPPARRGRGATAKRRTVARPAGGARRKG